MRHQASILLWTIPPTRSRQPQPSLLPQAIQPAEVQYQLPLWQACLLRALQPQLTSRPSIMRPSRCQPLFQRLLSPDISNRVLQAKTSSGSRSPNAHGFIVAKKGAGSPGHETTTFGPATKAALIRFQDYYADDILTPNGLSKGTGYFGSATMREVNGMNLLK